MSHDVFPPITGRQLSYCEPLALSQAGPSPLSLGVMRTATSTRQQTWWSLALVGWSSPSPQREGHHRPTLCLISRMGAVLAWRCTTLTRYAVWQAIKSINACLMLSAGVSCGALCLLLQSIRDFAHSCFQYALDRKMPLYLRWGRGGCIGGMVTTVL